MCLQKYKHTVAALHTMGRSEVNNYINYVVYLSEKSHLAVNALAALIQGALAVKGAAEAKCSVSVSPPPGLLSFLLSLIIIDEKTHMCINV